MEALKKKRSKLWDKNHYRLYQIFKSYIQLAFWNFHFVKHAMCSSVFQTFLLLFFLCKRKKFKTFQFLFSQKILKNQFPLLEYVGTNW